MRGYLKKVKEEEVKLILAPRYNPSKQNSLPPLKSASVISKFIYPLCPSLDDHFMDNHNNLIIFHIPTPRKPGF